MQFHNATALDSDRLAALFLRHTSPYRHDKLIIRVRYSRGADFSGSCFYRHARIYVNLGRHLAYPYFLGTHIARARSNRTHWWREIYRLQLADAYQLALFLYLHELYHFLIKQAGRCPRRKESRCDRFAARVLVGYYGVPVTDQGGRPVPRQAWDFQKLEEFVAAAPRLKPRSPIEHPRPQQDRPVLVRFGQPAQAAERPASVLAGHDRSGIAVKVQGAGPARPEQQLLFEL